MFYPIVPLLFASVVTEKCSGFLVASPVFLACRHSVTPCSTATSAPSNDLTEHSEGLSPTRHKFLLLRHGQSTANVAGIISSDPDALMYTEKHGLTALGKEQALGSAAAVADELRKLNCGGRVRFFSSPFARAKQTAEICAEQLLNIIPEGWEVVPDVGLDNGLRERYFGRLDGMKLYTYAYVWPVDLLLPTHTGFDVESVAAVARRAGEAVARIDASLGDEETDATEVIVLAGHADTLQILQVLAAGVEEGMLGTFSSYRFGNGEVRFMGRDVGTLPDPSPMMPPEKGT